MKLRTGDPPAPIQICIETLLTASDRTFADLRMAVWLYRPARPQGSKAWHMSFQAHDGAV